jgi:hypothetical protein
MRKILLSVGGLVGIGIVTLAFWLNNCAMGQDKEPAERLSAAEMEKLVMQLGSENAKTREMAARALLRIGEGALPFLKAAMKAEDAELRRRAEGLHAQLFAVAEEKRIARQIAKASEFGIDVFVERVVAEREKMKKEDWETFLGIADNFRKETTAKDRLINYEMRFVDLPVITQADFSDGKVLANKNRIVAESVTGRQFGITDSLIVSRGPVANPSDFLTLRSIIFSAGNFSGANPISESMVFCAGKFEAKRISNPNVVVCGKGLTVRGGVALSRLICFGDADIGEEMFNTDLVCYGNVKIEKNLRGGTITCYGNVKIGGLVSGAKILAKGRVELNEILKKDEMKKVFGFSVEKLEKEIPPPIQFFRPELLGVGVAVDAGLARVARLENGCALQRAGLKAGDEIFSINRRQFKNADEFVACLRKSVVEKTALLGIRRAGENFRLTAAFQP